MTPMTTLAGALKILRARYEERRQKYEEERAQHVKECEERIDHLRETIQRLIEEDAWDAGALAPRRESVRVTGPTFSEFRHVVLTLKKDLERAKFRVTVTWNKEETEGDLYLCDPLAPDPEDM